MRTVIDIHTHLAHHRIYPAYWLEGIREDLRSSYMEKQGGALSDALLNNIVMSVLKDFDASRMIQEMDRAGIAKIGLMMADFFYGVEEQEEFLLRDLYEVHERVLRLHPDRFVVFAGVDPRRGEEGLQLFERGITQSGFRGMKLYPPCGYELNDPALYPYYELCRHHGLPVLTHVGPSLPGMKNESNFPRSILEVAETFPEVDFILGHGALLHYDLCRDLPLERENLYLEVSGFQVRMEERDSVKKMMRSLFDLSPGRILFGTDWPLYKSKGSQEQFIAYFEELGVLKDAELERFFYGNAASLLSLEGDAVALSTGRS